MQGNETTEDTEHTETEPGNSAIPFRVFRVFRGLIHAGVLAGLEPVREPPWTAAESRRDYRFVAAVSRIHPQPRRGGIPGAPRVLSGRFVNLFDPSLSLLRTIELTPGSRFFALDLDAVEGPSPRILASGCKALPLAAGSVARRWVVEGVSDTPAIVLMRFPRPPATVTLEGQPLSDWRHDASAKLLWVRFPNEARPRELAVQ